MCGGVGGEVRVGDALEGGAICATIEIEWPVPKRQPTSPIIYTNVRGADWMVCAKGLCIASE